jgi:hypothetical protein
MAAVVLTAASNGEGSDDEVRKAAAIDEVSKALRLAREGENGGDGVSASMTGMGTGRGTGTGGPALCKPGKGVKCAPPDRVIHANPYISNLPAGRPLSIRQVLRVNQEIANQTAAVRALAKTPQGKAELDAEEVGYYPAVR